MEQNYPSDKSNPQLNQTGQFGGRHINLSGILVQFLFHHGPNEGGLPKPDKDSIKLHIFSHIFVSPIVKV